MSFVLPSRYCEVDSELLDFAWERFAAITPGWARVEAICDFVHSHIRFDYQMARANRTALDAFKERVGVCRDFTHLAITLCRCLNIPARYVTGYLGDIGVATYSNIGAQYCYSMAPSHSSPDRVLIDSTRVLYNRP